MADSYPDIAGLDIAEAVKASTSTYEDYLYILKTYYRNMDKQAGDIINALDNMDIADYTIYVHALKSSSRSVGAYELGEMAYELELCGKAGDIDTIKEKTPGLINELGALKHNISVLFNNDEASSEIDIEDYVYMLENLKEYMQEDDIILVSDMLEQLEATYCNKETQKLVEDITGSALNMEYGKCIAMIDSFLSGLRN